MITEDVRRTSREFSARNGWDCNKAFDLAVQVLTECNWHSLADKLKEAAQDEMDAHYEDLDLSKI